MCKTVLLAVLLFATACVPSSNPDSTRARVSLGWFSDQTVTIPGSKVSFRLVKIPFDGKLQPFLMGAHEVTWQECELFRKENRWWNSDDFHLMQYLLNGNKEYSETFRPTGPVVGMTWYTAVAYCEWLSEKTGCYFRLPTEREWEYVARAGDDQSVPLDDKAWHLGNSGGWIHPVGQKMSNSFGIHDMLGNAWEYVLEPPSPPGFDSVARGGSWRTPPEQGLATRRQTIEPDWFEADVNRPRRLRWFVDQQASQGMRLVAVAGSEDQEERKQYRARIEVRLDKTEQNLTVKFDTTCILCTRVRGTVKNVGDQAVDDLEVQFFPLDTDGNPHLMDKEDATIGLVTWGKVWPALSNSVFEGPHRRPLAPGETRTFEGIMPQSFDGESWVPPDPPRKFAARVANLRFSP